MSREKTNNFKIYNKYFDVYGNQNMNFVLKDNISLDDSYTFRGYIPFDLLLIFLSEPVLETLEIEKSNQKVFVKK